MRMPLVLLPGTLCDAALWSHQTAHLADSVTITIGDLTRDSAIAAMARRVLDTAPERFALAGLSLGGIVALAVMQHAPKRVTRLALLDTTPNPATAAQIAQWRRLIRLVEAGQFTDVVREEIMPGLLHPARQPDQALTAAIRDMAERVGPAAYVRQLRALIDKPDSRALLAQIACPTLLLVGHQDAVCPVAIHVAMAGAIPNARLIVVEQCGHLSSMEQPQAVTAHLHAWLESAHAKES